MKLGQICGYNANSASRNITFKSVVSKKNIPDLTKVAEFRETLQECQQLLKALEGTSGGGEFDALMKLTAKRLAELKKQRNPELPTTTRIVN